MIAGKSSEAKFREARHLIDEAEAGEWFSVDNQTTNQFVTIELPARTTLKTIVFDNNGFDYEDRFVKDVTVAVSDVSATEGFQKILEATLEKEKEEQSFPVSQTAAGRWVRLNILSNHGSPKAVQLREIRGYGKQEPRQFANISGTYEGDYTRKLHIKQEGSLATGCFDAYRGVFSGTIEGRTLTLVATLQEEDQRFIVINFSPDGKKYTGVWWEGAEKRFDNAFTGDKLSDEIGNCEHFKTLDGSEDSAKATLEKSLAEIGRAVLYGINFDFNSDKIKDGSKPALEKVVAVLKEKPAWKIQIEGHTDNVGGENFNQTLSENRAAAVKNYLINNGVDASRLNSAGHGYSKPVAANDTETGRAQNRRVVIVKQ
jgi:outer membrane protein OmpA-like peptidoglycan-associated protein